MAKPRKIRVDFRKNRSVRRRGGDLTRSHGADPDALGDMASSERLSGKGELTRRRTVRVDDDHPAVATWRGQVLHVHGLESFVRRDDDGTVVFESLAITAGGRTHVWRGWAAVELFGRSSVGNCVFTFRDTATSR